MTTPAQRADLVEYLEISAEEGADHCLPTLTTDTGPNHCPVLQVINASPVQVMAYHDELTHLLAQG